MLLLIYVQALGDVCYTVTLTISGDDEFYVYHDGSVVHSSWQWWVAHTVRLDDACVLAVQTVNTANLAGLLASTSTGVVTDASWKCSSVEQTGWHLDDFDDAAWSQARVISANDGWDWPLVPQINSAAQWIWSQDNSHIAYCRKTLC